jgi:hypothetical protein
VAVEVGDGAVEVVGHERAAGASRVALVDPVPEAEHEVVDEQLRAPVEELRQGLLPVVRLEGVLLLDWHPGQLLALSGKVVAMAHVLLLGVEQLAPRRQPLLPGPRPVLRHPSSLSLSFASFASTYIRREIVERLSGGPLLRDRLRRHQRRVLALHLLHSACPPALRHGR